MYNTQLYKTISPQSILMGDFLIVKIQFFHFYPRFSFEDHRDAGASHHHEPVVPSVRETRLLG